MDSMINRDAEIAILGTSMLDSSCAIQMAAEPEDLFAGKDTQAVHRAIKRLCAKGLTPDLVSVADECRCDITEPEALLIAMQSAGFAPSMYRQYEAILLECRKRRRLYSECSRLIAGASNPGESMDALTAEALKVLQESDGQQGSVDMPSALTTFLDSLSENRKGRCYTGIAGLDVLTGGFRGGKLVVLGARPGVGKTALALSIAVNVARHTGGVLIVSLEMDEAEIMSRIIAAESGVDVQTLEAGAVDGDTLVQAATCYGEVSKLPIRIATRATTPLQARREAVQMQQRQGLAMVVVDYIQLMRPDGKGGSRYEEVSSISRELKLLAMDLGVPVLALTQFNRQSEGGVDGKAQKRKPSMAEAKDSGSIEQDANLFLIQFEPPEPTEQGTDAWEAFHLCQRHGWAWQLLTVEKNRQGRTGAINIAFDKPRMTFRSIDTRRET